MKRLKIGRQQPKILQNEKAAQLFMGVHTADQRHSNFVTLIR